MDEEFCSDDKIWNFVHTSFFSSLNVSSSSVMSKDHPTIISSDRTVAADQEQFESSPSTFSAGLSNLRENFILTEKVEVNGKQASALFNWLKLNCPDLHSCGNSQVFLKPIRWNFGVFVVNGDRSMVKFLPPFGNAKRLEDFVRENI